MARSLMIFMLVGAAAIAQGKSGDQRLLPADEQTSVTRALATQPTSKSGAVDVSAEPVITLHGLCDRNTGASGQAAAAAASCSEVVTRQQFDTVMDVMKATGHGPTAAARRSVAQGYADLLTYATAAVNDGVDKDPRFAEVMEFVRLRALSDMYRIRLEERAHEISNEELQAYYQKNIAGFEELTLRCITLPSNNSANLSKRGFQPEEARRVAEQMRGRAAHGEDMDKLQKEAFDILGVKAPPPTLMVPIRRGAFDPEQEQKLFALQPGGVTPVIEQPSVYLAFRLEGRKTLSIEDVKAEISQTLSTEKMDNLTKELTGSLHIEFNDRYFGGAPGSAGSSAGAVQNKPSASPSSSKKAK